jgi:hypothetical protein
MPTPSPPLTESLHLQRRLYSVPIWIETDGTEHVMEIWSHRGEGGHFFHGVHGPTPAWPDASMGRAAYHAAPAEPPAYVAPGRPHGARYPRLSPRAPGRAVYRALAESAKPIHFNISQ